MWDIVTAASCFIDVLIYGSYTTDHTMESHLTLGDGRFGLASASLGYYWKHYIGHDPLADRNPLAAPLEGSFHGLPPLFVISGGLDPVRDESRSLAAKLALAGQAVEYREYAGLVHGFMHYYAQIGSAAHAVATIGEYLARHLAPADN